MKLSSALLLTVIMSTTAYAGTISLEGPDYIFNKTFVQAINYKSTSGCMETVPSHGFGPSLPSIKTLKSFVVIQDNNKIEFDYKGKSSVCRFRAFEVELNIGMENGNDRDSGQNFRSTLHLRHLSNNESSNEVKLKCQIKEYPASKLGKAFSVFECKNSKAKDFNSTISLELDLTKDTNITIETIY